MFEDCEWCESINNKNKYDVSEQQFGIVTKEELTKIYKEYEPTLSSGKFESFNIYTKKDSLVTLNQDKNIARVI